MCRPLACSPSPSSRRTGQPLDDDAAALFGRRHAPLRRVLNNYVRNAVSLTGGLGFIDLPVAEEALFDLNSTTEDGLSWDMQNVLRFLYNRGLRRDRSGNVTYQASVSTIATGIGKGGDTRSLLLRIEPYLIQAGPVAIGAGGRRLTDSRCDASEEAARAMTDVVFDDTTDDR